MSNSTLHSFNFPSDNYKVFCDDLIAHFRALKDLNGKRIFPNPNQVKMGLGFGEDLTSANVPAIRIWCDIEVWQNGSETFFLKRADLDISLYIYYESHAKDRHGDWMDFATEKHNFCMYLANSLEENEDGVTGLIPRNGRDVNGFQWDWTDKDITIDHTSVFKKINNSIILTGPLFGSRMDCGVRIGRV